MKGVVVSIVAAAVLAGCSVHSQKEAAPIESGSPAPSQEAVAPSHSSAPAMSSRTADFATWIAGSRRLLQEEQANDLGMLFIGVTICRNIPISSARAAEIEDGSRASGVVVTAEEVLALESLAEATLCPGGVMLPEPRSEALPSPPPTTSAPRVVKRCPTMKQLQAKMRIVKRKPSPDGVGKVVTIALSLDNPRTYALSLYGDIEYPAEFGPEQLFPAGDQDILGLPIKPGRQTIRLEMLDIGGDATSPSLRWRYWTINGEEDESGVEACEQSTSL